MQSEDKLELLVLDKFEVGGVIIMTFGERFYELRKKRVTLLFMAVMCIVFVVYLMLAPHPFSLEYLVYGNDYGLITEYGRLVNLADIHPQYWRIITCSFIHAGIPHLLVNLLALYISGTLLEGTKGSGRLTFVFGVSGIGSSIINMFSTNGAVGASGAIYGVICYVLLSRTITLKDKYSIIKFVVLSLYLILPNLKLRQFLVCQISTFFFHIFSLKLFFTVLKKPKTNT